MRTNCGTHYDAGSGNNDKTSEQISGVKRREALVSLTVRYFQDHLAKRSSQPSRRLENTNMNRELN